MGPENDTIDGRDEPDALERPLPPPPTLRDLLEVTRRRFALVRPRPDPTRLLLALAAIVGLGGMVWALWGQRGADADPVAQPLVTLETTTTTASSTSTVPDEFVIDVAGAVREPGPVPVPADGRVEDAIRAAGGFRADADPERVDRAALLSDGQRVYVPARGQTDIPVVVGPSGGTGSPAAGAAGPSVGEAAPVNVNTAEEAELVTLPGVGPATAQAILDHRRTNGPFGSVDDLLGVKGIGPAKLETLRPHVTV